MIPAFLLSLREGLEAALIVSVTLSVLARTRRKDLLPAAWLGVALAAAVSTLTALVLSRIGAELEGLAEEVFEGVTMILAAGLLTWMILWMRAQGRQLEQQLEANVRRAALEGHRRAVFAITFLSVLREGVGTALFLTAAAFRADAAGTLIGGLGGLVASVIRGWGLYTTALRLNIRRFFRLTGLLVLLFAAGLVAHGVHEFNEAGLIPAPDLTGLGSLLGTRGGDGCRRPPQGSLRIQRRPFADRSDGVRGLPGHLGLCPAACTA